MIVGLYSNTLRGVWWVLDGQGRGVYEEYMGGAQGWGSRVGLKGGAQGWGLKEGAQGWGSRVGLKGEAQGWGSRVGLRVGEHTFTSPEQTRYRSPSLMECSSSIKQQDPPVVCSAHVDRSFPAQDARPRSSLQQWSVVR